MNDDDRRAGRATHAREPVPNPAGAHEGGAPPGPPTPTWLDRGVSPERVADFFAAAAALWRAAPWQLVPDATRPLAVSSEALGVEDVLSVSGQDGTDRALRFFARYDDFEAYARHVAIDPGNASAAAPPHLTLAFLRPDTLAPSLRAEIERYGWEIAAEDAWPRLRGEASDADFDSPTETELENVEGVARALVAALADPEPLRAALEGGAPYARAFDVVCGGEPADVTIDAPAGPPPERALSMAALVARASDETVRENDVFAGEGAWRADHELLRRFALAADPPPTPDTLGYVRFALGGARDRFECALVALDVDALRTLVLGSAPYELDIAPLGAHRIVEVIRDFLSFVAREAGSARAGEAAASLDGDVVARLETALADPSAFGPDKRARIAVREAGLEPDSDAGQRLWASTFERALAELIDADEIRALPGPPASPRRLAPAERKARKKNRKAARKARRKSR